MIINNNFNTTHDYTTEELLGEFLEDFLPKYEIVSNRKVPNSSISNRPDFRIEDLKLIIEFNGKFHYTNPSNIINDFKKEKIYTSMGYRVFSLPYWIQLRSEVIYTIFEPYDEFRDIFDFRDFTDYPHGFQSKDCPLPSDFCELGNTRFIKEKKFWDSKIDKLYRYVDYSLIDRIFDKDSFFNVANKTCLPYFREMFENNGVGFGYTFTKEKYPQIQWEMKNIW